MRFGFFGKYSAVDEYDTNRHNGGSLRTDALLGNYNGLSGLATYQFNVNNVAIPAPDTKRLSGITFVAYDTIINGDVTSTNPLNDTRGFTWLSNFATTTFKNKFTYFHPDRVKEIRILGVSADRVDFFKVSPFRNAELIEVGVTGGGSPSNFKGFKGYFGNKLKKLAIRPVSTVAFSAFTTLEDKLPASFETLIMRANGIAGIINDRLSQCVNLKDAVFCDRSDSQMIPPYAGVTGINGNPTTLTGTINLSHCPVLENLQIMSSPALTNLILNPSATNFKFFQVNDSPALDATQLKTAINQALASPILYKFFAHNNNLTWTRDILNADLSVNLSAFYFYGNVITGSVTLGASHSAMADFRIGSGSVSITNPSLKNLCTNVDVSGLTGATTIDLSNSRIQTLTLPVNTVCTTLNLGGNKLDTTVLTNLMTQILGMTALTTLSFQAGGPLVYDTENGQDSTNGIGTINISSLTNLTTLNAHKSKLTGNITIHSALQILWASENNLTGITGTGQLGLVRAEFINNPLFVLDCDRLRSIRDLGLVNTAVTLIDLSNRTSVLSIGGVSGNKTFNFRSNPNLTEIRLPSNAVNAVLEVGTGILSFNDNPLLTTITNLEKLSYTSLTTLGNRSFNADNCSLNIDFKIGINNWLPVAINIQNNSMSQSNVDLNIDNIWQNRRKWDTTRIVKSLNIGGTNAAPGGTFQAPTGYKTVSISNITQASVAVVTVSSIGSLANNDVVRIHSLSGMDQIDGGIYMVKNISGNTFELYNETGTTPINSTTFFVYVTNGVARVEGTPASAKEQIYVLENVYQWDITFS